METVRDGHLTPVNWKEKRIHYASMEDMFKSIGAGTEEAVTRSVGADVALMHLHPSSDF